MYPDCKTTPNRVIDAELKTLSTTTEVEARGGGTRLWLGQGCAARTSGP